MIKILRECVHVTRRTVTVGKGDDAHDTEKLDVCGTELDGTDTWCRRCQGGVCAVHIQTHIKADDHVLERAAATE